jgi:putative ABC transport system permease protein
MALACLVTLVFGLGPALDATRHDVNSILKDGSGLGAARGKKRRLQTTLVVTQVALSLVLLIGAGLSLRSLVNASRIDPGFGTRGVAQAAFSPGLRAYSADRNRDFFRRLLERTRALPGVSAAAIASHVPLTFTIRTITGVAESRQSLPIEEWMDIDTSTVGDGYFDTLGIRVLAGRPFVESDASAAERRVVVNEALASLFWPGEDPLGRRLVLGKERELVTVIGVVSNAKYRTLGESPRPFMYETYGTEGYASETLLVKGSGDAAALLAGIRLAAREVDESVPMSALQTVEQATSVSLLLPRVGASLFGLFGLLGLVLAVVGLYGVIAFLVSRRRREIGVRVALGARPSDIVRMILGQGMRLTIWGVAIGFAGAFALARVISVILYGVSPADPITFTGVAALLLLTAAIAAYLPARRAAKVDPMTALRHE